MQNDTTSPLELPSLPSSIASLLQTYPKGVTIQENGAVVEAGKIEKITDLSRLAQIASEPKELTFEFHGAMVSLKLRGLTSEEAGQLDAMEEPRPPAKAKTDGQGRKLAAAGDELDWTDAGFRKKSQEMYELKRAIMISTALVGVQVPGNTAQETKENLKKMFPPQLLELLREKILSLTTDPIAIASFS